MRILVTGSTGFVGQALVPGLLAAGHQVCAGTRHPEDYRGPGQAVALDLTDPSSIEAALEGCQAAYYLVHSMATDSSFAERDRQAAHTFAAAAATRNVKVIYLGGLGAASGAAEQSEHLRSRHEVGEILRQEADAVELQAAIVIGAGSASFEILRQLVDRLPAMICPRWVTTRCQPIAVADAVAYLVGALAIPPGAYEIGGADVVTYEDMMRRYARITGRRRFIAKVPVLSPGLSSHWIGVVTDQPPAVARPLIEGLAVEVIVRDDRIRQLIELTPVGFDDAVRAALDARPAG